MIDLVSLDTSRAYVFREILLDEDECFQHFTLDDQHRLQPGIILTKSQHFELLNRD